MSEETSMSAFNQLIIDFGQTTPPVQQAQNQSVTKFSENFWDDKLNGYFVIAQNLRNTLISVKELEVYLRECVTSEDQYIKQLNKCTAQIQKFIPESTVSPLWTNVLKEINERNSESHTNFMTRVYELIKDVQVYSEELRKKRKN